MEFSPFVDLELLAEVFCVDVEIPAVSKASYGHLLLLLPLLFPNQDGTKNHIPHILGKFFASHGHSAVWTFS